MSLQAAPASASMGAMACLRYGLLGLPLAFVALPLYVVLPHHYALTYQLPLAWIGSLLLAARLGDALIDPWLGRWVTACTHAHPAVSWAPGGSQPCCCWPAWCSCFSRPGRTRNCQSPCC